MEQTNEKLEFIMKLSSLYTLLLKSNDRRLSTHGISFSEYMVLYELSKAPNHSMRRVDLAQSVGLSASGITRIINPMEKIKLVEKESNPRDARVSLVKLSDIGIQVQQEALASLQENANTIFEGIDITNLHEVFSLLKQLEKNI